MLAVRPMSSSPPSKARQIINPVKLWALAVTKVTIPQQRTLKATHLRALKRTRAYEEIWQDQQVISRSLIADIAA